MAEFQTPQEKPRRTLAHVSIVGTTQLHLRNPYVVAVWSAMFPGFGHLLLSKYLRAYILFLWEIVINLNAHVNMALFLTVLGKFDEARETVDIRWSLLYIPPFIFAVWDSYRAAVDLNKQYILASRENAAINVFSIKPLGITYLDKRSPWVTSSWCAFAPGLGHVMLQRLVHGFFVLFWWVVVVYNSNILTAIHLSCFGDFVGAREVLNPQWFLNIPSLFFFCVYTTYVNSVESNKLFDREQADYLKKNYQSAQFPFPLKEPDEKGVIMYVMSVYEQSIQVELAVTALEETGISRDDIIAAAVERESRGKKLFDSMRGATGESVFDLAMILAAIAALFGCIYGYILSWGPVVWGVLSAFIGFFIGFLIKIILLKKKNALAYENEVIILVSCEENKTDDIKRLLRDNGALGVSVIKAV